MTCSHANFLSGTIREHGLIESDRLERLMVNSNTGLPGMRVRVVVLPEKIIIGAAPAGWNGVRGRIEEIVYLGEATKYYVRTETGRLLAVKQLNRQLERLYEIGSNVQLSWHPIDCRVSIEKANVQVGGI